MTLVVEDGTGLSTANSYISVADAETYFTLIGFEDFAGQDDAEKEAQLVRATFGLDNWLRGRWVGTKLTKAQALAWPRTDATDEDGFTLDEDEVPEVVKRAVCEIARIEMTGSFIEQSVDASNSEKSVQVGPISVEYDDSAPSITYYPQIMSMLRGLANTNPVNLDVAIGLVDSDTADNNGSSSFDPFDFPGYFDLVKNY